MSDTFLVCGTITIPVSAFSKLERYGSDDYLYYLKEHDGVFWGSTTTERYVKLSAGDADAIRTQIRTLNAK